jgi:hypothetical protein
MTTQMFLKTKTINYYAKPCKISVATARLKAASHVSQAAVTALAPNGLASHDCGWLRLKPWLEPKTDNKHR